MKYITETEFIGHERHIKILDDTPVMGAETKITKEHFQYGPYKTERGAENALKSRKEYWRKEGFKCPPKGASSYDPLGNFMFNPNRYSEEIIFSIEEKIISKKALNSR